MKSKRGVYYDLEKSTWRCTVDEITYVFSSELHLQKFRERLEPNRESINTSLSGRFNLDIDVSIIADLVLYRKIETRGFLIETKEGNATCLEKIKITGATMLIKP